MTAPNRLAPGAGAAAPHPITPAQEREDLLQLENFLPDPSHKEDPEHYLKLWRTDREYRLSHPWLPELIQALTRFMNRDSRMTSANLQEVLDKWLKSKDFTDDPLGKVVLKNVRRVLRGFQSEDNRARADEALKLLPAEPAPPKRNPAEGWVEKPNRLVVGVELENDHIPYGILDFAGLPLSAIATEQNYVGLKGSVEYPVGEWTGMARLGGGVFSARNIPGTGAGDETGTGYRVGLDVGWVDPYAKSHDRAGFGLELTGVSSHAGEESGLPGPSPVVRLHLFRESDFNLQLAEGWELGVSIPLMHEETYYILGGDTSLTPGDSTNPLSTSGNLFAKNPMRMLGISGRYYLEGSPGKGGAEDPDRPFREGEGGPKLGQLWTGQLINFNRREDIPAFANTQVLLGTFWPQGVGASLKQFDTISTGLTLYSAQDGWTLAKNARLRSEIWRRDENWLNKGLMLGADAFWLGYNLYQTVTLADDPPANQSAEEFAQNPGYVRDFEGRVGRISLPLGAFELGLSALDASGYVGHESDPDAKYKAASWAAAGVGLVGVLFSGPLSGNGCDDAGLLRCGFPGNRHKYFKTGIDAGPDDIRAFENQYIVSTMGAGLLSWGLSRVMGPMLFGSSESSAEVAKTKKKSRLQAAGVTDPYIQASVTGEGGQLVLGGRF